MAFFLVTFVLVTCTDGQTDRQKATHKSQQCMGTGGLNRTAGPKLTRNPSVQLQTNKTNLQICTLILIFPLRHKVLLTKKRIKILSAMCWLVAFSLLTTIFFIPIYSGRTNNKIRCLFSNYVSLYIYEYGLAPFTGIQMVLILVFYGRMLYLLKRRDKKMASIATSSAGGAVTSSGAANNVTNLAIFVVGKDFQFASCILYRGNV